MWDAGTERRSFERFTIPVPLRFRISERKDEWKTRAVDLSDGGVAFLCPYWIREGTILSLVLPVGGERFSLRGIVSRCQETETAGTFRVGLYFLRPTRGFRIKLAEEVEGIRRLRRQLHSGGGDVSLEEAAQKYIEAASARHPDVYD